LALEALSRIRNTPIHLIVAGDGPLREKWEQLAIELGLRGSVTFLGRVPWQKMPEFFGRADAFIFTSLRDAFGTQVLEAMAHSLPILTLNHQGVRDFVPDSAGIKVSVTSPEDTVAGLAKAILRLAGSVEERRRMGEFGRKSAEEQSWERRALKMSALYQDVISASARHPQKDFEFGSAAGLGVPVQVEGLSRARTGEDAELRN
jgi:glycosyltransferase involved in cell wall biosynthesis